jgi:hypothetical protein
VRPPVTNRAGDPYLHFAEAWLPVNSADPKLFKKTGLSFGIKTTFDTTTHFTMEGIFGSTARNCIEYQTVDLVRINP